MRATVKVTMLKDAKGAPDSVTTREYKAGETYDVPEDLAACFFDAGLADPAEAHEPAPTGDAGDPQGGAPAPVATDPVPAGTRQRKRKA